MFNKREALSCFITTEYNLSLDPTASFAGRNHSEKSKTNMSDAKKGIQLSEETKTMMSRARTGKTHSEETKKKSHFLCLILQRYKNLIYNEKLLLLIIQLLKLQEP